MTDTTRSRSARGKTGESSSDSSSGLLKEFEQRAQEWIEDPSKLVEWARMQVMISTQILAHRIHSPGGHRSAVTQQISAIKELMQNIEVLLQEAQEGEIGKKQGQSGLAPTTNRRQVGTRKPWEGESKPGTTGSTGDVG